MCSCHVVCQLPELALNVPFFLLHSVSVCFHLLFQTRICHYSTVDFQSKVLSVCFQSKAVIAKCLNTDFTVCNNLNEQAILGPYTHAAPVLGHSISAPCHIMHPSWVQLCTAYADFSCKVFTCASCQAVRDHTGDGADKWGGRMGQQQAALEQLYPDMRPQAPQPPIYQHRQDQQQQPPAQQQQQQQQPPQLIAVTTPTPLTDDILAGDIEQLNGHLHTARFCNTHKAGTPAAQPPAAAGAPLPNGSAYAGGQSQSAQQRRADANGFAAPQERSRAKDRHDRWAGTNGAYPSGGARLAQSNSPPMTPAYAQSHGMAVPAHLLQYHFPGHLFIPPNRDMRHSQHQQHQHQQQRQQAHMNGQYQYQQPVAMPPWQPHPPRASSVDNLHRSGSVAASTDIGPGTQPHPPPISAPSSSSLSHDQLAVNLDGSLACTPGWEAASRSSLPSPPNGSNVQLPIGAGPPPFHGGLSAFHGPATVDSPPAPKGIWGDGLHQQRLTNLANDLASVRVAPAVKPSAEAAAAAAPAATANPGATRKEAAPSSSRSAGNTPHAGDSHRARGNFPFDSSAALNKRRQRLPHNASAHELGQSASGSNSGPQAPPKRERTAKLSLDSLTSQAEAAQRQRALAGFELKTDDFPALGGMPPGPSLPGPSIPASPGMTSGNHAPHGKAWSETDALGPPVHKSPPE